MKFAGNLAYLAVTPNEGKGKSKDSASSFPVEVVHPKDVPPALTFYSVSLPKPLGKGDGLTFDVLAVFKECTPWLNVKLNRDLWLRRYFVLISHCGVHSPSRPCNYLALKTGKCLCGVNDGMILPSFLCSVDSI